MLIAEVVGVGTATIKHPSIVGHKLLLVQPRMTDGLTPDGYPLLAVDGIGAGKGDMVMITSDGSNARQLLQAEVTPVRWTVLGIKDEEI